MPTVGESHPNRKHLDLSVSWRLGYFDPGEIREYYCMRANQLRFRRFQEEYSRRLQNHFYITVVPNTLNLLDYCLELLPRNLNVFLISNGLRAWEQQFIETTYPQFPVFTLTTLGRPLLYDRVLDLLVENNDRDFGVIDQDCFVLDDSFFGRIRLNRESFAFSPFVTRNGAAKIDFPRTYFLYFNLDVIRRIRDKYSLSFKRCWTIPRRLEAKIKTLNLGYDNFPHASLDYFDNFQLIWAAAMAEGYGFTMPSRSPFYRLIRKWRKPPVVHIGSGHSYIDVAYRDSMLHKLRDFESLTRLEREKLSAAAFSHFAHLRLLEHSDKEELKTRYLEFFSVYEDSNHVAELFKPLISREKIETIESVVEEARAVNRRG